MTVWLFLARKRVRFAHDDRGLARHPASRKPASRGERRRGFHTRFILVDRNDNIVLAVMRRDQRPLEARGARPSH